MRGSTFAVRSVLYMIVFSFVVSLFGLLTDGYGCFLLIGSEWFQTVGGVTLFGMLMIETVLLLGINLICFGLIAFTGDDSPAGLKERVPTTTTNVTSSSGRSDSILSYLPAN